jgi:pre-mRNA-splicing factor ATP-dependent RNA helicase DHX16
MRYCNRHPHAFQCFGTAKAQRRLGLHQQLQVRVAHVLDGLDQCGHPLQRVVQQREDPIRRSDGHGAFIQQFVWPDVVCARRPAAAMGDTNAWVKNQLFDVLGFAEKNLTGYVVSLAKKSKSESELLSNLAALDVPTNARTKRFAQELMARSGASGGGTGRAAHAAPSASQRREQESRALAAKNDTFTMLKEPELDLAALKAAKKVQRKLRKRSAREDDDDDDAPAPKRTETEDERKIRLMDEDQAEMQAFSGRLKDRDDAKTKKSMLDEDKTGERLKELAQLKQDEREDHLKSLRVRSREDYLVKRTSQKLVELEADLKDEVYLYDGVKLTKKERIEKEMKQELLKLAMEKQNMNFDEGGYNMPVRQSD